MMIATMRKIVGPCCAAAALMILIPGCSQHQKAEANDAAQKAEAQAKQATAKARQAMDNGSITLRVKTAFLSSERLNTSKINVDTDRKVVHLRGSVPDSGQRQLAERITRDTVGHEIKVVNELHIGAPAKK